MNCLPPSNTVPMSYTRSPSAYPTPALIKKPHVNISHVNITYLVNETARVLISNITTPRVTYTPTHDYPIALIMTLLFLATLFLRSPQIYLFLRLRWLRWFKRDERKLPRFVYRHN